MVKSAVTDRNARQEGNFTARRSGRGLSGFSMKDGEMRELIDLIYQQSGIVLTPEKKSLITSRLQKRLKALGAENFGDYLDYLKTSPQRDDEIVTMIDEITTNKTAFFRESHHFDYLTTRILPKLAMTQWSVLNVWSAGCSTGEEPYTLAMVLADYFGGTRNFRILATDLSTQALQSAYRAVYPNDLGAPIPFALRKKYTMTGTGSQSGRFRIVPELRDCVSFQQVNLISRDWGIADMMDIIFCRNVMIYFDDATKVELVRKFYEMTEPGGYLFIGHAESISKFETGYQCIKPAVYRKG